MRRFSIPRSRTAQSWNLDNRLNIGSNKPTRSYKRFMLLVWKNYKLQIRHKTQTITEVLLPLLFTIVLVIVRNVVPSTHVTEPTIYGPLLLENYPPTVVRMKCNEIYYTPNNPLVNLIMQKVKLRYFDQAGLKYNFTAFDTEEEMVEGYTISAKRVNHTADPDATSPVLAGITFENINGSFPSDIRYKLRFPANQRSKFDLISERLGIKPAWYTELIYPLFQLLGPRSKDDLTGGLPGYNEEGFLYLQNAIDRTLTRELLDKSEVPSYDKFDIKLQRFPYGPYYDDKYLIVLQGWLPFIIMLSFIYPVINITKSIVYEKEKRLKEYMKMMGLNNWMHWMAWFTKCFIFLIASVAMMSALLKAKFTDSQDLAILSASDGTVIFFVFAVFSFQIICFTFFVSSLFSDANAAATAAGTVWFLYFVPYGFLQPQYNLLSRTTKLFCSFLNNTAVAFACQILCMFEGRGEGCQWSTIFQASGPDDNFSMGDCILMMILNGIVYLLLALYIEAVRPGDYGVPLPWNFLFTKWYWAGQTPHSTKVTAEHNFCDKKNPLFEPEPKNGDAGVQIHGISKKYYNGKVAVKNMFLNMYEGQTTALLGHNGAGKTTTMSILTGLIPPSSGTAYINGHDICTNMNAVRSSLGLCPQHDVLFDELTVEEHLKFFSQLKGMDASLLDGEVNRMITALGLDNKRHAQSRTLSGGMKRKLSVGIAFCGGSKVVLLDEPSSGMDPGARRSIWDLIQSEKKNRTVLLSTHFMEEADLLGDRIAIMAEGEIQCCGSSLFLKKKYGGGYHLIIVKQPVCDVEKITRVLRKTIPDVEIDQNVGAELSYSLPDGMSQLFPTLFEELENKQQELGIASYGCSIVTLEEIFVRVGREAEGKGVIDHCEKVCRDTLALAVDILDIEKPKDVDPYQEIELTKRATGRSLKFQQFKAMIVKKCIYAIRNRALLSVPMGIPILFLITVLMIINYLPGLLDPPKHYLSLERYEKLGKTVTAVRCPGENQVCTSYKEYVGSNFGIELLDQNQTFVDFILEKAYEDLVLLNYRYIVGFDQRPTSPSDNNYNELVGFFNNQPFHSPPLSMNLITNAILRPKNYSVQLANHPFPYTGLDTLHQAGRPQTVGFQVGLNIAFGMSFLAASFVVFLIKERESKSKHLQFVSGVELPLFWVSSFLVDLVNFLIPCVGIVIVLQIFQLEDFASLYMQVNLLILLISYGLAIIPFMYLSSFAFTIPSTGFTRMVMFNIFTGMATMLSVVILRTPELQLGYVADVLNQIFLVFPNYAVGMGIFQLSTNFQLSKQCHIYYNLDYFCPAFPDTVCCAKLKSNYLDWDPSGVGRNIVYLCCSSIIYFLILFMYESRLIPRLMHLFDDNSEEICEEEAGEMEDEIGIDDSDVVAENHSIRTANISDLCKSNNLVLRNLTKYYSNFLAVDRVNLGVKKGECFGLLGINGAGKTTTFKMLTGDLSISYGDAYAVSFSIRKELKKVHENLGYCPQFDAIIDELTGRETIWMYARLRGIREELIDGLANRLAKRLLFSQHIDKLVGAYSGGNKRKLSTAIALIGNPPIVFLDEPTTGMDPVARRHLWNTISEVRDSGTSIILTSHSMEECEALCSRLAIMVNGRFRCLGSPQQLKSKFGEGYTLIAQTTPKGLDINEPFTRSKQELGRRRSSIRSMRGRVSPSRWETELDDLRTFIEGTFPGCILKDIHPGYVHYHITALDATWGKMFAAMEVAKEKFNLEAYSVGQTSLEQVFLNFTKAQINVDLTAVRRRCPSEKVLQDAFMY